MNILQSNRARFLDFVQYPKLWLCILIAACLPFLSGCATGYKEYAEAMKEKYEADGKTQVAKNLAEGEKWKALSKAAETSDIGRTVLGMAVLASELKGANAAAASGGDGIKAPRDGVDTFLALLEGVTRGARVGVEWKQVVENGATRRAEIAGNVEMRRIDGQTQIGIVDTVAKNGGTRITAGGDASGGNLDKRDCSSKGGAAGNGASSGAGGAGASGTATTGTGTGAAGAPSGSGGAGGAGGSAGGNCGP